MLCDQDEVWNPDKVENTIDDIYEFIEKGVISSSDEAESMITNLEGMDYSGYGDEDTPISGLHSEEARDRKERKEGSMV